MKLCDIENNRVVEIVSINLKAEALKKVISMGILPKKKIKIVRNAPLLDPIDIKIGSMTVALRRTEAKEIEVR